MITFLNKFFIDKFFILYFYISNSATYDFYITVFLNFIAIFYFLFMLYMLNFIAFLRNNFFNDLRVTRFIKYSLGLSTGYRPEEHKQVMETLAFYGYTILTILEILIKSTFLVIISYFVVRAPFISFDPSPTSSWKFADLFSKSRFYSYRPWTLTSAYTYRGFNSGNFRSEGVWIADDNDVVEAVYPRFLPRSRDFEHEDIFLRPGGVGLRLRNRGFAIRRFELIGDHSFNWTRHLLGSRQDRRLVQSRVSAPPHKLELNKIGFSRFKSLQLKPSIHESFSYYRSEDDCYPTSTKKGFLSRLYVPGFGSKARKTLIYMPSAIERDNEIFNGREMAPTGVVRGVNNHIEVQPYERLLIREAKATNTKYDPTADIYQDLRHHDFEKASNALQNNWLSYIDSVQSLNVENPTNYLTAKRFSSVYSGLNELVSRHGRTAGGYELFNKESTVLSSEELTLLKYFRYLTNDPSNVEQVTVNNRYNLFLNRNTPFRNVDVKEGGSSLHTHSFDNKFSFIHNLRGRHVYRRSLLDFVNIHFLEYIRSFSSFIGFGITGSGTSLNNPSFDTNSSEELFGFMINDRKMFYKKTFRYGIADEDNRPLQLRGRESFDLNYATAGSAFRYFFDDAAPLRVKDRVSKNSLVDVGIGKRKSEYDLFSKAASDRMKVNTGVYVHEKLRTDEGFSNRMNFYKVGDIRFFNQYFRMFYQFMLDHFTYWLRIAFSYMNRNMDVPHFPSPASDVADKPTGLNPYVIFFKTLYFFRKCFRAMFFGTVSNKGSFVPKLGFGGEALRNGTLDETSDFTLLTLRRTLLSYFARFLSITVILLFNATLGGLGAVFDFALNHIMAAIFLFLLGVISLLRVRYPHEFDLGKKLFRKSYGFKGRLAYFLRKALQIVKTPFSIISKSIDVLVRFFTTGNPNPSRKPKESIELYYERLMKEQQATVNILSFFKVDRIRRFLNRFGFLRSRGSADFKGYDKSIFRMFIDSLYKRRSIRYKKVFSSKQWLNLGIREWFQAIGRNVGSLFYKRSSTLLLQRYSLPYIDLKEKEKYFSFKPTKEFLQIKDLFVAVMNAMASLPDKVRELINRSKTLSNRIVRNRSAERKLKNNFRRFSKFVTRTFGNSVNYVKWKITEWINN
jgi:hypothetical protein